MNQKVFDISIYLGGHSWYIWCCDALFEYFAQDLLLDSLDKLQTKQSPLCSLGEIVCWLKKYAKYRQISHWLKKMGQPHYRQISGTFPVYPLYLSYDLF